MVEAAAEASELEKAIAGTIHKVDRERGMALGFAIVSTIDGKPYFDLQGDHIPEDVMFDAAMEFAQGDRVAKVMHQGEEIGTVLFSFPLTTDIAKDLGIETRMTGLLIGMKANEETLKKMDSGELTGFSIAGSGASVAA